MGLLQQLTEPLTSNLSQPISKYTNVCVTITSQCVELSVTVA